MYPFATEFYAALVRRRPEFDLVRSDVVERGRGFGLRVDAGQALRIVQFEGPQIVDLDLFNAQDPGERFASGAQFNIEGGMVTQLHARKGDAAAQPPARSPP